MNEQGTYGGSPSPATGPAGAVKDEVQRLASEAKDETQRVAAQARDQAAQLVSRTKDQTAQRLGSLASALRAASRQMETEDAAGFGRYAGIAADQVDKVSDYLGGKDLRQLVRDTETFARRHPDLFLGGAFVAGVMIARFIKSSSPTADGALPSGDLRYGTGETGYLYAERFNREGGSLDPAADFGGSGTGGL